MVLESVLRGSGIGVPKGSYFSIDEFPPNRIAAIKWVDQIGDRIAKSHPEIADVYRDRENPTTYLEIAKQIIPEIAQIYPAVASKAVGHAVRQLIPEEEQKELTAFHRAYNLEQITDRDSPEWRAQCRAAWEKRQKMHGTPLDALIRGRGQIPWSPEEKAYLSELLINPAYQHQSGSHRGKPDYELIAIELDIQFHDCEEVRTHKSVRNYVMDLRRKNRARK
jgi:hypothetical protein